MAEFVCPLCATIHLSGSTITLTSCAMAVMVMTNQSISFGTACNVTGDGAIAVLMDAITGKKKAAAK